MHFFYLLNHISTGMKILKTFIIRIMNKSMLQNQKLNIIQLSIMFDYTFISYNYLAERMNV